MKVCRPWLLVTTKLKNNSSKMHSQIRLKWLLRSSWKKVKLLEWKMQGWKNNWISCTATLTTILKDHRLEIDFWKKLTREQLLKILGKHLTNLSLIAKQRTGSTTSHTSMRPFNLRDQEKIIHRKTSNGQESFWEHSTQKLLCLLTIQANWVKLMKTIVYNSKKLWKK